MARSRKTIRDDMRRKDAARACFVRAAEALEFPIEAQKACLWAVIGLVKLSGIEGVAEEAEELWKRYMERKVV